MKKIFLCVFLSILFSFSCFSQTSSPASNSQTVSKEQTVARLISEVKAARALINAQTEQIAALETLVKTEAENSSSLNRSYEFARS